MNVSYPKLKIINTQHIIGDMKMADSSEPKSIWGKIIIITGLLTALGTVLHEMNSEPNQPNIKQAEIPYIPPVPYTPPTKIDYFQNIPNTANQSNLATTCTTLQGSCIMGLTLTVGSPCSCYNAFGMVVSSGIATK